MSVVIRKVANGYIVNTNMPTGIPRHCDTPLEETYVFETMSALEGFIEKYFVEEEK